MTTRLGGIDIRASAFVPEWWTFERLRPDWRRRLARNLSGRPTRPWLPLSEQVQERVVFVIPAGATPEYILAHPNSVAMIRGIA